MTKILRKYLGVLAALPFLLASTVSGAFEVPGYNGFAVGVGLTGASLHTKGTETDAEGTIHAGNVKDSKAVEYASIFGEVRFTVADRLGLTLGASIIPGEAEFVKESKPDTDLTSTSGGLSSGTSKVTGQISGFTKVYIQPTVRVTDVFSVYLTAGLSTMDIEGNATLVTSTDFNKTIASDGTHFGVGVMADLANGFFVKVEGNASDYDSVTFTTADSTTAKADMDEESVSLLLGKAF